MNFLYVWRRRRLQRDLELALSDKAREERIHRRNLAEMDKRINQLERDLAGLGSGAGASFASPAKGWALD